MITEDPQALANHLAERYKLLRELNGAATLKVGVFGARYASFHEYGTKWSHKMPGGFFRAVKGKKQKNDKKNVMEFMSGMRNPDKHYKKLSAPGKKAGLANASFRIRGLRRARLKARPFMRPAFEQHRERIMEIMAESLGDKPATIEAAFTRIGNLLQSQIAMNIQDPPNPERGARGPIIDSSDLINSVRYRIIRR